MKLADLEISETPACRAALDVATAYCSPALLNHSVRAYLWAAGYALAQGIAFDAELLYVSAMLHDLALVKEFDNHTLPFEEAGGHVAWVFGAAAGWPRERRHRAAEIIVRQGQPMEIVQRVLGHRDIRSTQGYAELDHQQLRDALEHGAAMLHRPRTSAVAAYNDSRSDAQ